MIKPADANDQVTIGPGQVVNFRGAHDAAKSPFLVAGSNVPNNDDRAIFNNSKRFAVKRKSDGAKSVAGRETLDFLAVGCVHDANTAGLGVGRKALAIGRPSHMRYWA